MIAKSHQTISTKSVHVFERHTLTETQLKFKLFKDLANYCWSFDYFENWLNDFIAQTHFESVKEITELYNGSPSELFKHINNFHSPASIFFKESVNWDSLKHKILELDKKDTNLRFWITGIENGESVYSFTILLEQLNLKN